MKKNIYQFILLLLVYSCNKLNNNQVEKQKNATIKNVILTNDKFNSQILYHGDCSYSLSETEGWIANSEPPQNSDNIKNLVIYEPDSSIKHLAPIGIISNVIFKEDFKDLNFNGFLNNEMRTALERGEKVINARSIKTKDNKTAIVKEYFIDDASSYFAIAYIDEPKYIIMVTFSTQDINDFINNFNSFENIVKSYKYIGMNVIDETKKAN